MNDAEHHPLPVDHPGVHDPVYRKRRAVIAAAGSSYRPGDPIPAIDYSAQEDDLWRIVSTELAVKHQEFACEEYLRGTRLLVLPTTRVPQLKEVDQRVSELTGFHIQPVPGLVSTREFYGALARRTFLSTQYVRHHSVPFYTPEPDIIHEIIGHANMLASAVFADLYEAAGRASLRTSSEEALEFFSRVFWFTLEFGTVRERGEVKAYGAGLLSSFGEIDTFRDVELRPWDIGEMGSLAYDITHYQSTLFCASSFGDLVSGLRGFFEEFDESTYRERYARDHHHPVAG
jgi:phenylalanine-4-hydroxylase